MKNFLIQKWTSSGLITDKNLIEAFKKIPREKFIPKDLVREAYADVPLPIGSAQTISQPTTIMIMTQALDVKPGQKILEIGSGSGYQAALLAELVKPKGKIFTIEIIPELALFAKENLVNIGIKNVEVICADGSKGLPKYAPFDRIIITAAAPETPAALIKQLKNNGILVAPIGPLYSQQMLKIIKKGKKLNIENLGSFVFVPLKGKYGY